MKYSAIVGAAFSALACASPVDVEKRTSVQRVANFDDLAAIPGVSQVNPVGTYMGIDFNSFNVLLAGPPRILGIPLDRALPGLKPRSQRNYAANSVTGTLLTGSPAFIVDDDNFKSFDLQSVFFGCAANSVTSLIGVPQSCTIAFTAHRRGQDGAFETINMQFTPDNPVRSELTKANFPKTWSNLERVDIAIVQATTPPSLSALIIDDASYKLNQ
ncbi:hypothetical protein MBLNU230_g7736t1 [Neophaeotheca triangularis]